MVIHFAWVLTNGAESRFPSKMSNLPVSCLALNRARRSGRVGESDASPMLYPDPARRVCPAGETGSEEGLDQTPRQAVRMAGKADDPVPIDHERSRYPEDCIVLGDRPRLCE